MPTVPEDVTPRPQLMPTVPQDVTPRPEGVTPRPEGLTLRPEGVTLRPEGLMPRPEGVMPRPEGVTLRPEGVTLRPEAEGEAGAVRRLVTAAFGAPVLGDLVDDLRASDAWVDGLSYVAESDGALVGQVLFTRSLLDAPQRLVHVLVLSPLSVVPAYWHGGIGGALVRYGLGQVRDRAEPLVFLEGSPAYYARFGFEAAEPVGFRRPSLRIPAAAFQVVMQPSYEPWMTGTLVYAEPWWRHDCVGLRGEAMHGLTDL